MTNIETDLRATLMTLQTTITVLFEELKQAVAETDPEAEAYVLMEKMAIIFEKHTAKIVGTVVGTRTVIGPNNPNIFDPNLYNDDLKKE